MKRLFSSNHEPSRELVPIDDVVDNLPYIAADDWAQCRSFNDESRFTVHTATEVIIAYQDGEEAQ